MTRYIETIWECDCCGKRSEVLKEWHSRPKGWIEEVVNPNTREVYDVHFCCKEHRDIYWSSLPDNEKHEVIKH